MGFTLIEVLIAMTLLSIMVVLLFSSLRICAKSWEQGESKIAEVNEVAVVYNFFQRHLSSAIPVWDDFTVKNGFTTGNQDKTFSFQGKKQSLQFVSVFPASAGRTGMQLFLIEPQEQDGERLIKVTLTPFYPVTEGEEWHREEVVLLRHVSDFSLAYFGADDAGEAEWQEEWLEKGVQPRLVKISINTNNGVYWADMMIELKVSDAGVGISDGNGAASSEGVE
ncbi:MAG: prepilin-type N-terminal cleavage/methylation domain-containing protein [Methylobacter sp.]|nr:prepilin-type N-terminal cleavage/methylation domain-containing protein [Methylobacter sp.]